MLFIIYYTNNTYTQNDQIVAGQIDFSGFVNGGLKQSKITRVDMMR